MNHYKLRRIVFSLVIVLLIFSSCGTEKETFAATSVDERMPSEFAMSGQYIYFSETITDADTHYRRIVRMNLETGQVSCPCVDPLCSHNGDDCPLCGGMIINPIMIYGDWLYYNSTYLNNSEQKNKRIIYNLKTGEWREIFKDVDYDSLSTSYIVNIDSYLYHLAYLAKEKDIVTGEYTYSTVIKRYDLINGNEKIIYTSDEMINIKATSNTRLYFGNLIEENDILTYSIDINGNDIREEPKFKCWTPVYLYSDIAYYYDKNNLFWINNLKTGETSLIIDSTLYGSAIYVTDQYIYYMLKDRSDEMIHLNPYNYRNDMESFTNLRNELQSTKAYIWRCNHDGSDKKMIMELPGATFMIMKVYGNYIYTIYSFYNTETHEKLGNTVEQNSFCRINIDTGEITMLPRSDNYSG